ncbi:hypothetical protein VTN96DRAFT_8356 [Rasamsonia emersonii]|uniref:TauD/TfdA-like domain-containing protein n=1 Tax=Rasamsonia emersonii (strain ATCC 16479 / CBS 393.64 / IMI 116815) TaxID=1408163 RepID=A0A0F4YXV0_RASE3|nr:hypothetical protein T310_3032 [Rasamsonia emersonii CBS 393.64]KKA22925.1 hypothetical protein T310_3032 [Rasamsonia emersonii CBS 393.64]
MATAVITAPQQPDIEYAPNVEKWRARTQRRLQTETLTKELPPGFPKKLVSDLVWEGDEIKGRYNWIYELNEAELNEIENALEHFKSLNKPLGYIDQDTFPLPTLHATLRDISKELHEGHGFKVLRGLPVDKHTREENIIIYAGVSSHIAPIRGRQDRQFEGKPADVVLNHIKDLSNTADKDRIGAPAYTTEKQVFHTDAGDIVSLFALSVAAEGGQSQLASSWRVYNELAETRPDLIHTLAEDWPFDGFGNPQYPYHNRPLLFHQPATATSPERVLIQYARRSFTGYQALPRSKDIPPITEAQAEALDTLHFLAEKYHLALDFRKGDVQYINNLSIFHAREGFRDTPEQQRHLVRLWLRDPEYAWPTPEPLKSRWINVYDDVKPENQVFPLEPTIRSASAGGSKHSSGY